MFSEYGYYRNLIQSLESCYVICKTYGTWIVCSRETPRSIVVDMNPFEAATKSEFLSVEDGGGYAFSYTEDSTPLNSVSQQKRSL